MIPGKDNTTKIYGLGANGNWIQKAIFTNGSLVYSVSFSSDGGHVMTQDNTVKIYGQDVDGSGIEKAIITHFKLASFSTDCRHVVAVSDKTAKIYGQGEDGSWINKAIFTHSEFVNSAECSSDGLHVVTVSDDNTVKIGCSA